jgi:phage I-like protein
MQILVVDDSRTVGREVVELLRALNSMAEEESCIALNFEIRAGEPPTELMLIPPGDTVQGRDGRFWKNPFPQGIVDHFNVRGADLPIDLNHATELKAPLGEEAPASGWIKGLRVAEGGAVYGRTEWTPSGREAVMNREYRYISPVLLHDKDLNIRGLSSIGLTNKPNLFIPALNHEQLHQEGPMDLKQLLASLGLPETATFAQALNQIGKMQGDLTTALNHAQSPPMDKFIPRSQFDAAVLKANNMEQQLNTLKAADRDKSINAEISAALKAGKITPATKDYYTAQCRQEGGLEQFKTFVQAAPVIGEASTLDTTEIPGAGKALNASQKEVYAAMGMTEEDYLKAL